MAQPRFCRILRSVPLPMRSATGTSSGSERMSTTSAVSMATSVPAPDRDAEVGYGQCRGVVDSVADHGHPLTGPLELRDLVGLVPGQDFGDNGVDAELVGDPGGGGLVVSGEHDHLDPRLVQGCLLYTSDAADE